jgi:uncharacterized protein
MIVLYHGGCWDGLGAAWAVRSARADCEFVGVSYGKDPPYEDCAGKDVAIVDFSYRRPKMLLLCKLARSVMALDHHATAREELEGLAEEARRLGLAVPYVEFDMARSGAALAWLHFRSDAPMPWPLLYIEDRDLWRFKLPASREVNAYIRSLPYGLATLDELAAMSGPSYQQIAEGAAVLRWERQIVEQHASRAAESHLCGYSVLRCNATCLWSEIAGELAGRADIGAVYYDDESAGLRRWSLRSKDDGPDVSKVARTMGGGGHPHAAGYEEKL